MKEPLTDFMGRITHREFRTWVAWKKDQLNNPSRSDYYSMQTAGYVAHVMSKKSWSIKNFKIPFQVGPPSKAAVKQQVEASKATWRQRLSFNRKKN